MIKKILSLVRLFVKIKISFGLPSQKKILLYDEIHSLSLSKFLRKDFNILNIRNKKIYFWIYLKQVFNFDFKFNTYCQNYIKFTSPKIIITFNETRLEFYEFKNKFKDIKFISIGNVCRSPNWFDSIRKLKFKKLKCDHFFVINKYYKEEFRKTIDAKYHVIGNFFNNNVSIKKNKFFEEFLFISQWHDNESPLYDKENWEFTEKLLTRINLYLSSSKKKIHILLRIRKHKNESPSKEINFYKKIFKSNCVFHRASTMNDKHQIIDRFNNIIFMYSTLGFEAISRKKKVAIFSPKYDLYSYYWFGWPAPYKKGYDFFLGRNLLYSEIKRILDNIKSCSQKTWEKEHLKVIKDQFYFDKNNSILRNVILRSL